MSRDPVEPARAVVACAGHRELARRAAVQGMVLLRNEQAALPLPATVTRLALAGALADAPNLGDHGSSRVYPPATCTIRAGLRSALPGVSLVGPAEPADAAVVVVGMSHNDEGERIMNEDLSFLGFPLNTRPGRWLVGRLMRVLTRFGRGGDRVRLTLSPRDEELIATVAAAHPRTIVVLIGGSAILMEAWRTKVPAILMAWYPGMEGGRAVADVLTGAEEPGGRLPFAIPTSAGHLPFFDAAADRIEYDAWWGQRKLDRDGHPAAYPFGFGLGYTTFDMSLVSVHGAVATVDVANTGGRPGSTVVQVYAVGEVPQLVGFRRVALDAGAATTVDVDLDLTPTLFRDPGTRTWHPRPGSPRFVAAPHSMRDPSSR
ncbi:glycoside hydrolase family 3 C-terminal domain-containing protein [Paractinoplanes rishiriensis]|uniref:glycoside hydrolase family 3 C-terminal domain-containing protein n=1 Tax=Paractinoplanes rishiriensis TaxID=1050105 RepID=UPI0019413E68|nr:glycoside hydrolase family 3 C-terminal domain-containing protein [Actinoplanes rishiriensis]